MTFAASEKTSDVRHTWFVERYGQTCCELDALNPNTPRELVENAILGYLNREAWDRAEDIQAVELASIADFIRSYPGTASA